MDPSNNPFDCPCTPPSDKFARKVATLLHASFPPRADLNTRHAINLALPCQLQHGPNHPPCIPPADLAVYIHMGLRHAVAADRTRKDHAFTRTAFEAACALLRYHRSFAAWFDGVAGGVSRVMVMFDLLWTIRHTLDAVRDIPDVYRGLIAAFVSIGTPECLGDLYANEATSDKHGGIIGFLSLVVTSATAHTGNDDDDNGALVALALALWEHRVPENACAILPRSDDHVFSAASVSVAFRSFAPFCTASRPNAVPWPAPLLVKPVCDALRRVACQSEPVPDGVRRRAIVTLGLMCTADDRELSEHCAFWMVVSDDIVRLMSLLVAGPDAVDTPDTDRVTGVLRASEAFTDVNDPLRFYQYHAAALLTAFCWTLGGPPPGLTLSAPLDVAGLEAKLAETLRVTAAPNAGGTDLPGFFFRPPLRTLPAAQRSLYVSVAEAVADVRDSTESDALREACAAFLGHAGWVRTRCGNSACKTHESVEKLKICARCQAENYCGATCQKSDWPRHKKDCKK